MNYADYEQHNFPIVCLYHRRNSGYYEGCQCGLAVVFLRKPNLAKLVASMPADITFRGEEFVAKDRVLGVV